MLQNVKGLLARLQPRLAGKLLAEMDVIAAYFDRQYYLDGNEDVARSGMDPLLHFSRTGWREGRDPTAEFSTLGYLAANPDVQDANINPFWHYIVLGRTEGRKMKPDAVGLGPAQDEIELQRQHFDRAYYLRRYSDVEESGQDPLLHFCRHGWKEGRDPSAAFSTSYYLSNNPDVAGAGINPFWHYLVAGIREQREPRHPGGARYLALAAQVPLEETVARWRRGDAPPETMPADRLGEALRGLRRDDRPGLTIAIGHDDYRRIGGGVQLVLQREQELSAELGRVYLNLHPWQPIPRMARPDDDPLVCVVADGETLAVASMSAVVEAAGAVVGDFESVDLVVHHLLGHAPEAVAALAEAATGGRCLMWLHDYFLCCPSYALQRNNSAYCGGPPPDSNACFLCLYGAERRTHTARLAALFDRLDVALVAPSQVALEVWQQVSGLRPASQRVVPHLSFADAPPRQPAAEADADVIRLAFSGTATAFKGWLVFAELHETLRREAGLDFWYFGTAAPQESSVRHVPVTVRHDTPEAMIDALAEAGIDLVLHWASWPETFSYSTCEAIAAGAGVITNAGSGNVAALVRQTGAGAVLEDEADLAAFLTDGRAAALVREIRERRARGGRRLVHSRLSYDALQAEHAG